MKEELQLRVDPAAAANEKELTLMCARKLRVAPEKIGGIQVFRRSIDARQKRVLVNLALRVWVDEAMPSTASLLQPEAYRRLPDNVPQAVVVGAGPAGLFAALRLIQEGVRPILLERGKSVDTRGADMARIARENHVDPDSNYCFGEGGAGAYSDGKLFTRSKKRGPVEKILQILVQHGAREEILIDAHPHIGTDRLPKVVKAIRETILRCGGEVHFSTRVERLLFSDKDGRRTVVGVETADGKTFAGPVILATGHSARDVYERLVSDKVEVQPKGIAVGVRLEHPQQLIDRLQYHSPQGRGKYLPAAEYSFLTRVEGRGVYSFCMCPGGVIVPAATGPEQLVVNGMSPASRGGRWANSGMVVEVLPEDLGSYDKFGPLKVMHFQHDIEKRFFEDAKGTQNAPAQRMTDFVACKPSASLPATSYAPGIHPARIDRLLPAPIARRLQQGFRDFDCKQRGFLTSEATLIGCETRTSSPVRIPRDPESLCHVEVDGLYPAGEGAGYAGGIVSAALDGDKCAATLALKAMWPKP